MVWWHLPLTRYFIATASSKIKCLIQIPQNTPYHSKCYFPCLGFIEQWMTQNKHLYWILRQHISVTFGSYLLTCLDIFPREVPIACLLYGEFKVGPYVNLKQPSGATHSSFFVAPTSRKFLSVFQKRNSSFFLAPLRPLPEDCNVTA